MRTADLTGGGPQRTADLELTAQEAVRLCIVEPVRLAEKSLDVAGLSPRPGVGSVLCTGPAHEIGPLP